jgi:uncharacterized membrane protein
MSIGVDEPRPDLSVARTGRPGPRARLAALGEFARSEPWLFVLVVVMAVSMSLYCVVRYESFGAGLDLSLFDQAIWHYSHFQAPYSTIKGFDLLGDHFHPTVALLAPLYWVWSDPRLLLTAASLLVAASIVPVFLFAPDRLDRLESYLIAFAYAVFWGLQIGVGYEFHEVDLGPLLIALAIVLADRQRWAWFYLVIALTLGVKEDLGLFVAFFGVYLVTRRDSWRGVALIAIGLGWYELATRVFIPDLNAIHGYTYWTYGELGKNLPSALWALIKAPWRLFTIGLSPSVKAHTLLYLFAPFAFLSLCSRWFLLAIPLLAERFLSTRSALWGTNLMYSLTIAPVLTCSAAQGLTNLRRWLPPRFQSVTKLIAPAAALASLALTISIAYSPFRIITQSSFYNGSPFQKAADAAIAHVPSGAPVTANDALLTHLSARRFASEIAPNRGLEGYLVANLGEPVGASTGNPSYRALGSVLTGELAHTTPVFYDDYVIVSKLPPPGQQATNGVIAPLSAIIARPLLRLTATWQTAVSKELLASYSCYISAAHTPATPCSGHRLSVLERADSSFLAQLALAGRMATGPCRQLAGQAYGSVADLGRDLVKLGEIDPAQARGEFLALAARISLNINYRDLIGHVERFDVLCTPRG